MNLRITRAAGKISQLALRAVAMYAPEVQMIIVSHCKDKQRIETTLDGMLSFCWNKKMVNLYKKLCSYYYGIDQRATAEYVYAYRDMWDQKSSQAVKK